jgi:uncharacterized protein YbjT (DUF2867 family)
MRVAIFGATGMIGQAVMRACLADPDVSHVTSVVRTATGSSDGKLVEIVHRDFTDFSPIARELAGHDACLFCLGVSSVGMTEAEYRHITYDFTLAAAKLLAGPQLTFVYVTGTGTGGKSMWARVKAETEAALFALPFKAAYMFRPGWIQPMGGIKSRTRGTRIAYAWLGWLYPLLRALSRGVVSSDELAAAMLTAAKRGAAKPVIESREIRALAAATAAT